MDFSLQTSDGHPVSLKPAPSTILPFWGLRHPVSGLLHLAGALGFCLAAIPIVHYSIVYGDRWHLISSLVYGVSLVLLYLSSSAYHLLNLSEKMLITLRKLDHSMIYIFIAGCYTPVCLVLFRESIGWWLFGVVWFITLLGIGEKFFFSEKSRWIRVFFYLAMSWMSMLILTRLWKALGSSGFIWFALGGASYTLGAIVYALKRPDPSPRYFGYHEIWHVFVLLGSVCHFWMIKYYVLKLPL